MNLSLVKNGKTFGTLLIPNAERKIRVTLHRIDCRSVSLDEPVRRTDHKITFQRPGLRLHFVLPGIGVVALKVWALLDTDPVRVDLG